MNQSSELEAEFNSGFSLAELFLVFGNGIVTKRDSLCIQASEDAVWQSMQDFLHEPESRVREKYAIGDDVRDWTYQRALNDVRSHNDRGYIKPINYRPFDKRYILYTGESRGFVGWPVPQVMNNYLSGPNFGLLTTKGFRDQRFAHVFVTDCISEAIFLSSTSASNAMNFPLYLYQRLGALDTERQINFNQALFRRLCKASGLGARAGDEVFVFDYIYATLHASAYRTKFTAFLRNSFPRIPFPKSPEAFASLARCGSILRRLHLGEALVSAALPAKFEGAGDGRVIRVHREHDGRVQINDTQWFSDVPEHVWEYQLGGYKPAYKWLNDRKGSTLQFAEIGKYQRLLAALRDTWEMCAEINSIFVE